MINTTTKKALTPKDCEDIYGLNVGTLANMRFKKIGPRFYKCGKKVLYKPQDIEEYINSGLVLTKDSIG